MHRAARTAAAALAAAGVLGAAAGLGPPAGAVPVVVEADGWVLDPAFSGDGRVTTWFSPASTQAAWAYDVAVQPDGRTVVAGELNRFGGAEDSADVAVARYLADGTLDPTFGDGGRVLVSRTGYDDMFTLALQQIDGQTKILVAGHAYLRHGEAPRHVLELVRLNPDGSLDTDRDADPGVHLGADGWRLVKLPRDVVGHGATVLPDGRILAYGDVDQPGTTSEDVGLAVLLPRTGALDPTFGDGGVRWLRQPGHQYVASAAAQPVGSGYRILVGGGEAVRRGYDPVVYAFTPDGDVDTAFGRDGEATIELRADDQAQSFESASSLVVDAEGRVVIADDYALGEAAGYGNIPALARFLPSGDVDADFGDDGVVTVGPPPKPDNYRTATDLVARPDGSLLWSGYRHSPTGADTEFLLGGVLADGSLDPAFGPRGTVTVSVGPGADEAEGLALDDQGRAIIAGIASSPDPWSVRAGFGVARLLP